MIGLFINGLAASAGGGLTYLRNVIPHLARRVDVKTTVLLNSAIGVEFRDLPNVTLIEDSHPSGASRRFIHEQATLPGLIRRTGAQVLISAGNFALWRSPVPQILLSRNALYTSRDFFRDVRVRGHYGIWADTFIKSRLARRSINRADITIAPSAAFARELSHWSGRNVLSLHHGFDPDVFASDVTTLSAQAQFELETGKRRSPPALRQPLQLLSEFRNPVPGDAHLAQPSEGKESEAVSYLPAGFRGKSRNISR